MFVLCTLQWFCGVSMFYCKAQLYGRLGTYRHIRVEEGSCVILEVTMHTVQGENMQQMD